MAASMAAISETAYSVNEEARHVFLEQILGNPLFSHALPPEVHGSANAVEFEGHDSPSVPVNWRLAESSAALHALQACMMATLVKRRFGITIPSLKVNTDKSQLFFMSALLWTIDPNGPSPLSAPGNPMDMALLDRYVPNMDLYDMGRSFYRRSVTNIYKTKDGRYFHLHGNLNPTPVLESMGLPAQNNTFKDEESAWDFFKGVVSKWTSHELDTLQEVNRSSGTMCYTVEEYRNSEQGRANADVGFYVIKDFPSSTQKPCWWAEGEAASSPARPLAGLRVLDLTRVIAAPTTARTLASFGASVMRVTAPHISDFSSLHIDLNWGKWNSRLDLRKEEDREALRRLISESDVVVQS